MRSSRVLLEIRLDLDGERPRTSGRVIDVQEQPLQSACHAVAVRVEQVRHRVHRSVTCSDQAQMGVKASPKRSSDRYCAWLSIEKRPWA